MIEFGFSFTGGALFMLACIRWSDYPWRVFFSGCGMLVLVLIGNALS